MYRGDRRALGGRDRVRQVREEPRHRRRRLEVALGVPRQPPARARDRRLVAQAREHVEQRTLGLGREPHTAGGQKRHAIGRGERHERLVVRLLVPQPMPLELHEGPRPPEQPDDAIEQAAHAVVRRVQRRAADERDEPLRAAFEILERERTLALGRAHLHPRDEPAQVAIPLARRDEHGEPPEKRRVRRMAADSGRLGAGHAPGAHRQLGADDGPQAGALRREVEPWNARDVVPVEKRERGVAECRRALHQRFGRGGPFEKRERRGSVELEIHACDGGDRDGRMRSTFALYSPTRSIARSPMAIKRRNTSLRDSSAAFRAV